MIANFKQFPAVLWFVCLFLYAVFLIAKRVREKPAGWKSIHLGEVALFLLLVSVGATAFMWLAIYNGYPLLYFDSAGYIRDWTQEIRPIGYNIFIRISSLRYSLWLTIFAQSWITSFLLMRTAVVLLEHNHYANWAALFSILLLVILTNVSKYASWLMPDIFASWIFFGCFLFLRGSWPDRVASTVIFFIAFFSHLSHLPLAFCFIAILGIAIACSKKFRGVVGWDKFSKLLAVYLVIVISIFNFNYLHRGFFGLSYQGSSNFWLSHMLSWGIAQKVLEQECPGENWKICAYQSQLKQVEGKRHDWLLWNKKSPLGVLGGWEDQTEQREVVHHAFRKYPWEIFRFAVRDGYRQLFSLQPSDTFLGSEQTLRQHQQWGLFYEPIPKNYPGDVDWFHRGKQARGEFRAIRIVPAGAGIIFIWAAAVLAMMFFVAKKQYPALVFVGFGALFIICNAFVAGGLSGLVPRYQERVIWVMLYCVLLSIMDCMTRLQHRFADHKAASAAPPGEFNS